MPLKKLSWPASATGAKRLLSKDSWLNMASVNCLLDKALIWNHFGKNTVQQSLWNNRHTNHRINHFLNQQTANLKISVRTTPLLVVVAFSFLARMLGECLTVHSQPVLFFFFFFFNVGVSSRALIPLFIPRSVHSGWANWDDCGLLFPYKLRLNLFPNWFPLYTWICLLTRSPPCCV